MSPLAEHCLAHKLAVRGSDASPNLATKRLKALGATIFSTHTASNIGDAATVVYSSAIKQDNPELAAAKAASLPLLHRSDLLATLMASSQAITVAGTHGKTTTSAMIVHMLTELGVDPSAVVGGRMLALDSYARIGHGDIFVAEADESDGTLVKYSPLIAVLTNIDDDHLDIHGSLDGLISVFRTYLERTSIEGSIIVGWDNALARSLALSLDRPRISYGQLIGSDVRLLSYRIEQGQLVIDCVVERDRVKVNLPMIGKHNAQNALCALAVARALDLDVFKAAEALSSFRGVARRLSLVVEAKGLRVFDDYAHNPGKIAACIAAVREAYPRDDLRVIFQPHRYSRLQTMFKQFSASFRHADRVYVTPVYAAGEPVDPRFTSEFIASAIGQESGVEALGVADLDDGLKEVRKNLTKSVIILTLGAGDVWQIGTQIKEGLNATQEEEPIYTS